MDDGNIWKEVPPAKLGPLGLEGVGWSQKAAFRFFGSDISIFFGI